MQLRPSDLEGLQATIRGRVLVPDDAEYDDTRSTWNKNIDQRPVAIVQPREAADIAAAIRFAGKNALPVAVQSTGHGAVLPCDGGLLINTAKLTGIAIDPDRRSARVEPGVGWGPLMKAAHAHGLAGRAGFNATVGVLGYTLGGGYGWLARRYGLACDAVIAADVALADGRIVRASEQDDADLLWALRGGGGNFGLVTSLKFGLVPLKKLYGGTLTFPLDRASEVLALFARQTADADTRLTMTVQLSRVPDAGLMTRLFGGKPSVHVGFCFLGDEAEGEALTRSWLDAGPAHGSLKMMATADIGSIEGKPAPGMKTVEACEHLRHLDQATINVLVTRFDPNDAPVFIIELRHIGGATTPGASQAAYDRREGEYLLHFISQADDPSKAREARIWQDGVRSDISAATTGAVSPGFVGDGKRGIDEIRRAFSDAHRARLRELKSRYDPRDMFSFNYSIEPAFGP